MKYDYIISEKDIEDMRHLFWVVYCDETRNDPEGEQLAYEALKALWSYQKYVQGIK